MNFTVIIPSRYKSSRLPGKPLADIAGSPMIVHVTKRALAAGAARVIVATDNKEIMQAVEQAGGEACLTRSEHQSGTERVAEVIERYAFTDDEIIVNVQGDEPLIPPLIISQVADCLAASKAGVATLAAPITSAKEAFNPNIVKVVTDIAGYALYFSRAASPWERERFAQSRQTVGSCFLRHIGIYAWRAGFIRRYAGWAPSPLEKIELLEQLRVLWYGEKIQVTVASVSPEAGVDTPEDLQRVRDICRLTYRNECCP